MVEVLAFGCEIIVTEVNNKQNGAESLEKIVRYNSNTIIEKNKEKL